MGRLTVSDGYFGRFRYTSSSGEWTVSPCSLPLPRSVHNGCDLPLPLFSVAPLHHYTLLSSPGIIFLEHRFCYVVPLLKKKPWFLSLPTKILSLAQKSSKCEPSLLVQPHFQLLPPLPLKLVSSSLQNMPCTSNFKTLSMSFPYPMSPCLSLL